MRAAAWPAYAALAAVVLAGLYLRVRHNGYGLPYVYNIDEGSHFTNRAVAMFGGSADPGYFQNPSAFTYLVHLALRFRYGHGWPFGSFDGVVRLYGSGDPSPIYELARTLAALVCVAGVLGVYWVGRRLFGAREGLVAAAILSFAFLPVTYSRIAVTDVGTLLPVALSLYGAVRIRERGELRHYALAGAGAGLAIGFKYTAGLVLLPLLIAVAVRVRTDGAAAPLKGLAAGLAATVAAFFVTTPYFFIDFSDALRQLRGQATTAGDFPKVGQAHDNGFVYYLWSLTWGLGWGALAAALGGAVLLARRDPIRALLLVAFPLALFTYLSVQSRFFGRWLLPAYPVLALLAGYALVQAVGAVRALRPGGPAAAAALALLTALVLVQPIAADIRTASILGRTDTRQLARDFLVRRFPPSLRIVIEPAVPPRYYRRARPGHEASPRAKQFVRGFIRDIRETRVDYVTTLSPATIDRYRRAGFCLVMTMSVIRGRAENDALAPALAYYRRLERESRVIYHVSPYDPGVEHLRFNFDHSYDYYPTAFARPGPEVTLYRLSRCRQGYGPVPKGTGTPTGLAQ